MPEILSHVSFYCCIHGVSTATEVDLSSLTPRTIENCGFCDRAFRNAFWRDRTTQAQVRAALEWKKNNPHCGTCDGGACDGCVDGSNKPSYLYDA